MFLSLVPCTGISCNLRAKFILLTIINPNIRAMKEMLMVIQRTWPAMGYSGEIRLLPAFLSTDANPQVSPRLVALALHRDTPDTA